MQLILQLVFLTAISDCLIIKPAQKKLTNVISAARPFCECVPFLLCENGTQVSHDAEFINIRFGIATNIDLNHQGPSNRLCDDVLEVCCEPPNIRSRQKNRPPPQVGSRGCGVRNFDGVDLKIMSQNRENEAKFGEFPWMVAVLLNTPDELDVYLCGGTLIHRKVVLTAAHCVYGKNALEIKIRAGEWDTQSMNENLPHQDRAIETIITHERYHPKSLQNDFALLMLSDPVNIEDNVDLICLPDTRFDFNVTGCSASGWGKDNFEIGGQYQEILKKIELSVIDPFACQRTLRRTRLGKIFELDRSFVCAGGVTGEDMCKGDGGSPLICPLKTDPKRYVQVGIVSWGIECGSDVPGVYARVLHARPWIDNQLLLHNLDNTIYQHKRYT